MLQCEAESVLPPIYLNEEKVSIVEHEKHLGNYVATTVVDRNMIANVCDLYQRRNLLISDSRVCDSIDLDSLHTIYCMRMYGSELWNLNSSYVDDFKVAWRKVKRRIWKLPCNTHNAIVQNLTYNIDDQLDVRIAKFTHMCLNHHNDVCRSELGSSTVDQVLKYTKYSKYIPSTSTGQVLMFLFKSHDGHILCRINLE